MRISDWSSDVCSSDLNFPALPAAEVKGIEVVQHGNMKIADELVERIDPRGRSYFWIGVSRNEEEIPPNTDFHALVNGRIPVTPLYLDLTHYTTIDRLKQAFS